MQHPQPQEDQHENRHGKYAELHVRPAISRSQFGTIASRLTSEKMANCVVAGQPASKMPFWRILLGARKSGSPCHPPSREHYCWYAVTRLLPENNGEPENCIKSADEAHERIVRESELSRA